MVLTKQIGAGRRPKNSATKRGYAGFDAFGNRQGLLVITNRQEGFMMGQFA
jgi:hypothetical protein